MGEKLHDSYIVSNTLLRKDIQSPRYSPQIQFVSVELKPKWRGQGGYAIVDQWINSTTS